MKNKFKSITCLLVFVLTFIGCNNDDEATSIEINLSNLTVTIDENPTDGQSVGTVQTNVNGAENFSITSQTPAGALAIDTNSGELTVADASLFDFETNPTISATITCDNAVSPATLAINLTNINEIGLQDLVLAIDENPTDGQVVGTVQANGSAENFSITAQTPTGALSIDVNSGELSVADASLFDFETNPVISATIAVNDVENPSSVTINLSNVNELIVDDLTVTMDENPTDGQVVGTVQTNSSETLSFSITSQTPAGALNINTSTGELTVVDPNLFDFETNPVITADISVSAAIDTATATATINLNNVDEISVQAVTLDIDENPTNGQVIGTLPATSSNSLTYTITFQNPAGAMSINQSTGELSVADATLFDYETNPNMLAVISVDNGTYSVSANAMVALNDLNEIGEFKYGGVIFWIDPASNNSEGLVCAIEDQSLGIRWENVNGPTTSVQGTSSGIGTGSTNTDLIIAHEGAVETSYAAGVARAYDGGGFNNWFLPSTDEIVEMYTNREAINTTAAANGGANFLINYWTSTRMPHPTSTVVSIISFNLGTPNGVLTANQLNVRAVRAWTDF